jgi:hypothetical protein
LVEAGWRGLRLAELVVGEVLKEVDSGSRISEALLREAVHDHDGVVSSLLSSPTSSSSSPAPS